MKISKFQDVEIKINEVTLLSVEEYKKNMDLIPHIDDGWWLRSPGFFQDYAAYVDCDGVVNDYGDYVDYEIYVVRPALKIGNPESLNLGDKFECSGYMWTMLRGNLALCDSIIGRALFDYDDSNNYETSSVERYVECWAKEVGIMVERKTNREERVKLIKATGKE